MHGYSYGNKSKNAPFRISNKGLDNIDRYLTLAHKPHGQQHKHLAEASYRLEDEGTDRQLWVFEEIQQGKFYRIKNYRQNRYLTLVKSSILGQYVAELAHLGEGQQEWSFDLAQNRRFLIKTRSENKQLYLESTQVNSLKAGYKTVFLVREKIQHELKRRYLQFWKLSPLKIQVERPRYNKQHTFKCLQEQLRGLLLDFKGPIYTKHTPGYQENVYQYATSSFPSEQMSPFILAEPIDIQDIQIMIRVSKIYNKKIVARSGGHQYSGTSSGGQDTIVISLNQFNDLKLNNEGIIQIGPCNALRDVSKQLRDWGLSVPHGVCPLVNIGGHAQTGGYGHFTRSFGLLIDYVQAFDIVLADGTFKTVKRPTAAQTDEQKLNLRIFRGVMGGNAGSFGIVTRFYIKPIKDEDHPESFSRQHMRLFNKEVFKEVLRQFKRWTTLIAEQKDQELRGLDLFFSLTQLTIPISSTLSTQQTFMSLTGLYSDIDGGKPYGGQFNTILKNSKNSYLQIKLKEKLMI